MQATLDTSAYFQRRRDGSLGCLIPKRLVPANIAFMASQTVVSFGQSSAALDRPIRRKANPPHHFSGHHPSC